jgi:polar amino acid transport system substrate-binding protein
MLNPLKFAGMEVASGAACARFALAVALLAGCSVSQVQRVPPVPAPPPPATRAELAPTGALRVAVFTGNPLIGSRSETGEVTGTTVILGKALAARLGVPVSIIEYSSIANVVEGAKAGAWDIAALGVDPARRGVLDYAPPHLSVDLTYLVGPGSAIHSVADADRPGVRVVAARAGVPAIVLERSLTKATFVLAENETDGFALLKAGKAQALAQNRSMLITLAATLPGSRVLDDRFLAAELAFALPKGRPAALAFVSEFVEQAIASGLVRRAIDEAGLKGVSVARGG